MPLIFVTPKTLLLIWINNNSFNFHYTLIKLNILIDCGLGNWLKKVVKASNNFLRGWTEFLSPLKHQNCLLIRLHNNSFNFYYKWMKLSTYVDCGLWNWFKGVMKPYINFLRGWTKCLSPLKHRNCSPIW